MKSIKPNLVYSDQYNIRLWGIEKIHPFDGCKYQHTWDDLSKQLDLRGIDINNFKVEPDCMVSDADILLVHTPNYALHEVYEIDKLAQILEIPFPPIVSQILGMPLVSIIAKNILLKKVVEKIVCPIRWSVAGTIKAAELALSCGIAINMSGGYHHAMKADGGGFCVFSDIAIAISKLRKVGALNAGKDQIAIIDLDAHQGNGLERIFYNDSNVHIMDIYNCDIYPQDQLAKKFIAKDVPILSGTSDGDYFSLLKSKLPEFIKSFELPPKLAFYNAGTDIYCEDPLGNLNISENGVFERDKFVLSFLAQHEIPCVMVLSGGYTTQSYSLVSRTLFDVICHYYCNQRLGFLDGDDQEES